MVAPCLQLCYVAQFWWVLWVRGVCGLIIDALCVFLGGFCFVAPYVTYWMYDEQWRKSESGITETTAVYHFLAFFVGGTFVSED